MDQGCMSHPQSSRLESNIQSPSQHIGSMEELGNMPPETGKMCIWIQLKLLPAHQSPGPETLSSAAGRIHTSGRANSKTGFYNTEGQMLKGGVQGRIPRLRAASVC